MNKFCVIEELKLKDIPETINFYKKGLRKQTAHEYISIDEVRSKVLSLKIFVAKQNGKIIGLLSFKYKFQDFIEIDCIYSSKKRKGVGKSLVKKLMKFAIKSKIKRIKSTVLTQDFKTLSFFEECGFRKYAEEIKYGRNPIYKVAAVPEVIAFHI